MRRSLPRGFRCSLVAGLACLPAWCPDQPVAELQLMVRTYNYAEAPAGVLALAEQEAAGLFRQADIRLFWVDCPISRSQMGNFGDCTQAGDATAVTLKLLTEPMAARLGLPSIRFGATYRHHASYVFYHRVHKLSTDRGLSEPVVLGYIMAHELGHLLLRDTDHSPDGLMKEDLYVKEFRQAEEGTPLTFSAEQSLNMRARLQEQLLAKK